MIVYLASSLRNHIANTIIADALRRAGISCFLPQEQAYNQAVRDTGDTARHLAHAVYLNNIAAIDAAQIIVVLAQGIGTDTAWECGYAIARGKRVVLVRLESDSIEHMYMLHSSIPQGCQIRLAELTRDNLMPLVRLIKSADS